MRDSLVIVAIPAEDDYVMEISSEKIPHLTLLYLGDAVESDELAQILDFVEHASKTIEPFYMDIESRGTLGEDEADVVFFERGHDLKMVQTYRDQLKQNGRIKQLFLENDKHPNWLPHLTLGYPETPAHEPENKRKLYSIHFDRIAVWNGDFKGMEFPLKHKMSDRQLALAEVPAHETALSHYGVRGMKWGVRRAASTSAGQAVTQRAANTKAVQKVAGAANARADRKQAKLEKRFPSQAPEYRVQVTKKGERKIETRKGRGMEPAPEAVAAKLTIQQKKASGLDTLSNKELKDLATRLQLEKQVRDLTAPSANAKGLISKAFGKLQNNLVNEKERKKNISNGKDLIAMVNGATQPKPAA